MDLGTDCMSELGMVFTITKVSIHLKARVLSYNSRCSGNIHLTPGGGGGGVKWPFPDDNRGSVWKGKINILFFLPPSPQEMSENLP